MITGSLVAIVTPMHEDGSLDLPRFRSLIDWHVAEGTDGIVVVGTTGESPTVDFDEHKELIRVAVEHAGRPHPDHRRHRRATPRARRSSSPRRRRRPAPTACLSVVPYYNKPTQEGLYRHFHAIAEAVDLPMILYNVPGRTVADLPNDTMLRLAQVPNIVGIKDATGEHRARHRSAAPRARRTSRVYSGDDATGARADAARRPRRASRSPPTSRRGSMHEMCAAALAGDAARARELNNRLLPLHQQAVRRGESDSGEVGAAADGPDRARASACR